MRLLLLSLFVILFLLPGISYILYYYRRLETRRKQLLNTLRCLRLEEQYVLIRYKQLHQDWQTACANDPNTTFFAERCFDADFKAGNSHKDYVWPVLLFSFLCGLGWLLVLQRVFPGIPGLGDISSFFPVGFAYGFIGAYFASLLTVFESFRRYDLNPHVYQSQSFRLMFSSFAAYVISLVTPSVSVPLVALGIGMFPLESTWSFITERAAQLVGASKPEVEVGEGLAKIQGLEDKRNRRKLLDVDISTVQALATSDPFMLFLETTFSLRAIVDMIDKAILYLYIGDKIVELREHGINGIIELVTLAKLAKKQRAFDNAPHEGLNPLFEKLDVEKVMREIGEVLKQDPVVLKTFIYNMESDPMVTLIYNIWGRYYERSEEAALIQGALKPRNSVTGYQVEPSTIASQVS